MTKTIILIVLGLIVAISVGIVIGKSNLISISINSPLVSNPSPPPVNNSPSPVVVPQADDLITGTIKPASLNQVINSKNPNLDNFVKQAEFKQAGVFVKGDYKNYKRYVALIQEGPGLPTAFVLVSNDYKSFTLDDTLLNTASVLKNDDYAIFSSAAVVNTAPIPMAVPDKISIGDFVYVNTGISVKNFTSGTAYELRLVTVADLKLLGKIPGSDNPVYYFPENLNKVDPQTKTNIYLIDPTGLVYEFTMTTPENYVKYQLKLAEFKAKQKTNDPQNWLDTTNLNIFFAPDKTTGGKHYHDYEIAFPGGCAFGTATWVVTNLNDSDLTYDQTIDGRKYYFLTDPDSPLNKYQYQTKIGYLDDVTWKTAFPAVSRPSYQDYLSSHPLLFFKDPFGRFVAVGEYDFKLLGGCGKPVIYLYPPRPTKVNLSFQTQINFDTQIPPYKSGWHLQANPDGSLTDLNWQLSDCNSFDINHFGSEYGSSACQNNSYPYLYWSGTVTGKEMPETNFGWIITKETASDFFAGKLSALGLTAKESQDFRDYWLTKIQKSASPYFKISFLIDSQVSQIFPMFVTPTPDSIRRVFVQIQPLANMPDSVPQPQIIPPFNRHGFTMIEWGATNF